MKRPISKTRLFVSFTAVLLGMVFMFSILALKASSSKTVGTIASDCAVLQEDPAAPISVSGSVIFEAVTGRLLSISF